MVVPSRLARRRATVSRDTARRARISRIHSRESSPSSRASPPRARARFEFGHRAFEKPNFQIHTVRRRHPRAHRARDLVRIARARRRDGASYR